MSKVLAGISADQIWAATKPTAVLVVADGTVIHGQGGGATGVFVGEVCFNTAMSGYQEIITDPSYTGQIVTFTFPHIGNVGTNDQDIEEARASDASTIAPRIAGAGGVLMRTASTAPSNYRSQMSLDNWLRERGIISMSNIDTRAITQHIRTHGMFNAVLAHAPDGVFDIDQLRAQATAFSGLVGADIATQISITNAIADNDNRRRHGGLWQWEGGFTTIPAHNTPYHVVALDFGIKTNILRCLTQAGCRITLVPALTTTEEILAYNPDGVFLSNGPGDPAASAQANQGQIIESIKALIVKNIPIFGICLGHQLLAHALGLPTEKMPQGHHGANHPVKDITTGKVEITSMNHGFTIARDRLPRHVEETHISLFDGTNCGIRIKNAPVFSVQYHPEASPGPQDSHYLFARFVAAIEAHHA